jgi:cobalt/nickel transport protein
MNSKTVLSSLAAALVMACLVSPFASRLPDGLDRFGEDHGLARRVALFWTKAPLAEYSAPFSSFPALRTGIAGGIGTMLVFGTLFLVGKLASSSPFRKRRSEETLGGPAPQGR